MNPQRIRSIDGVVGSAPATYPPAPYRTLPAKPRPPVANSANRPYAVPQTKQKSRSAVPEYIQLPLIIASGVLFWALAQSAALAQLTIIGYGIIALARGIPSRITFTFALLALSATVMLLVTKGDTMLSHNFAVYTFLLLVVGVITLNRELKKEGGRPIRQ